MYGCFARTYPAEFRARFAEAMRDSVEKDLGAARGRGRAAVTWFWALTLIDTLRFGLAERFRQSSLPASVAGPQGALMKSLLTTDLRDAWRSLRATPIVTTVAVLSLALGIGANTALFSILNSLVLKSLPVHDPQQLALLAEGDWTNPIWEAMRGRAREIGDGAFAWSAARFDLAERGATDPVDGAWISGGMFDVLGIRAMRGRHITEADDVRGGGPAGPVVMVSYRSGSGGSAARKTPSAAPSTSIGFRSRSRRDARGILRARRRPVGRRRHPYRRGAVGPGRRVGAR